MVAEPQYPRDGGGEFDEGSGRLTGRPTIAASEARMACPSEVPPAACSRWIVAIAWSWSLVGGRVVSAPWSKATTPMSTESGCA